MGPGLLYGSRQVQREEKSLERENGSKKENDRAEEAGGRNKDRSVKPEEFTKPWRMIESQDICSKLTIRVTSGSNLFRTLNSWRIIS